MIIQMRARRAAPPQPPPSGDLVVFSDPKLEFLLGPLAVAKSASADVWPWHQSNMESNVYPGSIQVPTRGMRSVSTGTIEVSQNGTNVVGTGTLFLTELSKQNIFHVAKQLTGTVQFTSGSNLITGVGTQFLSEVQVGDKIYPDDLSDWLAGTVVSVDSNTQVTLSVNHWTTRSSTAAKSTRADLRIASIQSDTQLTLLDAYPKANESGLKWHSRGYNPWASNLDNDFYWGYQVYYDHAFVCFQRYFATGDVNWLNVARGIARGYGENWGITVQAPNYEDSGAPRSTPFMGGVVEALLDDAATGIPGNSLFWHYLYGYADYQFTMWTWSRRTYAGFYYGIRDGGYSTMYAAAMAGTLPDSYRTPNNTWVSDGAAKRATFKSRVVGVCRKTGADAYYGRLQHTDGGMYWADSQNWWTQPFQIGLLTEAYSYVMRLVEGDASYATEWAEMTDVVDKVHRWLHTCMYNSLEYYQDSPATKPRAMCYNGLSEDSGHVMRTGTVTATNGSKVLTGSGTQFDKYFRPGNFICLITTQLTGTSVTANSGTLTGTGTQFTSELVVGSRYFIQASADSGWTVQVTGITSNTVATIREDWYNGATGSLWRVHEDRFQLTGTVSGTGTGITGSGTQFTTELAVGDRVRFSDNEPGVIDSITSNTAATMSPGYQTGSGLTLYRYGDSIEYVDSATQIRLARAFSGASGTVRILTLRGGGGFSLTRYDGYDQQADQRNLNPTCIGGFGWAYHATQDPIHLTMGDDLMGSSFGYGQGGPGDDGGRCLAYWVRNGGGTKEINESYRSSQKYLGWRAGG